MMNRRDFLKTCCAAGVASGLGGMRLAFSGAASGNVLIVLFLRGACDGLNLFPPVSGADRGIYEAARPRLKIPLSGAHAAIDLDGQFGLHPAASALKPLYDAGHLAIIRAVGNTVTPSRSHFDAQAYIESGKVDSKNFSDGWLTRLFQTLPDKPAEIVIPSVAATGYTPASFLADPWVLTMDNPENFRLNTSFWAWDARQLESLPALYTGSHPTETAGAHAVRALQAITNRDFNGYQPGGGAVYPDSYFGRQLKTLAQLIKDPDAGLRVAALDLGGWDTHNDQDNDNFDGWFSANLAPALAGGLAALITDLGAGGDHLQRTTVVVQTEFGRRLRENANRGTDHGYASDILLLGGSVNGGRFYGDWPGLAPSALFQGEDLMATTDFRHVLGEVVNRHMGNPNLEAIFPGYPSYQPVGAIQGADLTPQPPLDTFFTDGFEGDL